MSQSSETPNNIFKDTAIYIVSSGIGQMRLALFEKQIKTNGGKVLPEVTQHLTHIILEENIFSDRKKCINLLNKTGYSFGSGIKIVGTSWLSECLSQNKLIDSEEFEFILDNRQHNLNERVHPGYSSNNKSESEFKEDDKPSRMAPSRGVDNSPPKKLKVDETGFVGARTTAPCNELIISELQKLADAFRSYGDHWRVHGYERAVSAIGTYGKDITSSQEAHALPGVGAKMAAKVQEILDCGQLRKVQEICESEKTSVLELFTKVWGAGPSAAESWYQQGFRTLDDLREKAHLTQQQKIGLKHFEDIQERIPREEVEQIGLFVKDVALTIESNLNVQLCGSYRRGKATCGDIDILIGKPDNLSFNILSPLLEELRNVGFITDDLVSLEVNGKQKKYLGICRLPGNDKHRRLDIFVVPQSEYAPALMHYTGSALFNRSIRLLAIKKGMCLSEHCLNVEVTRKGKVIINNGFSVPTPTEESIFQHLGIEYRRPEERDHYG